MHLLSTAFHTELMVGRLSSSQSYHQQQTARRNGGTVLFSTVEDHELFWEPTTTTRSSTSSTTLSLKQAKLQGYIQTWLAEKDNSTATATTTSSFLPPNTPGAFLHIGKCGGSSIATQLKNGCHSWLPKPCPKEETGLNSNQQPQLVAPRGENEEEESYVSRLTTYFHVPDFGRKPLKRRPYQFYVATVRDPLERFISIFRVYYHSHISNHNGMAHLQQERFVYCFANLQEFGRAMHRVQSLFPNPVEDESTSITHNNISSTITRRLATAATFTLPHEHCWKIPYSLWMFSRTPHAATKVPPTQRYSSHWQWNQATVWERIHHPHHRRRRHNIHSIPDDDDDDKTILVLRTSHLWQDWQSVNEYLGQPAATSTTTTTSTSSSSKLPHLRHYGHLQGGISTHLHDDDKNARAALCQFLEPNYQAYRRWIMAAANLNNSQKDATLQYSQTQCPSIRLRG